MSAARLWAAAILFEVVGMGLLMAGALRLPLLLLVGLPFSLLGGLLLTLLFFGENLKRSAPERYAGWLWWVNLAAGIAGAAAFGVPAVCALPGLLLFGPGELAWLGALFSGLGLLTCVATALVAAHAIRNRPKEFAHREPAETHWETEEYRRWIAGETQDPEEGEPSSDA